MNETIKKELVKLVKDNADWIVEGLKDEWELVIYLDDEGKLNLEMSR